MNKEQYFLIDSSPYEDMQVFDTKTKLNEYLSELNLNDFDSGGLQVFYGKRYDFKIVLGAEK